MPYLTRQYGSNARWLTKALREVPHEIHELLTSMDERELRWRPEDGDWCAKEVAAFLLESEREDLRAVEAILRRDGAPIEERRAYLAPGEHDYLDESIDELVWDFMTERESLLWSLEWSDAWEHAGEHPYRGRVPLLQYLHEINERDLEAAWRLRKLQEALGAGAVRRR
ncbi:MAG TPA: hypothetical protein PLX85_05230 [Dehalococcoidia bacterium]|nr:hypothetical protein [Dehalococcoidia bacterium]